MRLQVPCCTIPSCMEQLVGTLQCSKQLACGPGPGSCNARSRPKRKPGVASVGRSGLTQTQCTRVQESSAHLIVVQAVCVGSECVIFGTRNEGSGKESPVARAEAIAMPPAGPTRDEARRKCCRLGA